MRKLFNRISGIICLPSALVSLGFYSSTKNEKEKEFYTLFVGFVLHAIKTGKIEGPESYMPSAPKRIYP